MPRCSRATPGKGCAISAARSTSFSSTAGQLMRDRRSHVRSSSLLRRNFAGGYVMNDNAEPDLLDFIRDPPNGFLSITLPLKRGTALRKVSVSGGALMLADRCPTESGRLAVAPM